MHADWIEAIGHSFNLHKVLDGSLIKRKSCIIVNSIKAKLQGLRRSLAGMNA